ncbi:MAG: class I SAM-dependent methyltransferase [Candidatus Bipolaricaulota bacterium]|nr:MAG: class I SAM-dependent methyltransferase [Candidatus Bipolaricaulota bacterium]
MASDVVRQYYDEQVPVEWARLERPYRRFELETTLHLIGRYFPPTGRVIDIGGGPGRYTVELLRRGYETTLVDLSPDAVGFARAKLDELGLCAQGIHCADACDLSLFPDDAFDAALFMGPLYHIVDRERRQRALRELRRLLAPGGVAIAATLNPWGILRSGLTEFPEQYRRLDAVDVLLETYVQTGPQVAFTEAVFLTPPDALREVEAAGFEVISRAGAEAFASGALDASKRIAEQIPEAYPTVLSLVARTCEMPAFRDSTEHQHFVLRTPSHE